MMYLLAYGPMGPILHLEKECGKEFDFMTRNDPSKGGVGTRQPYLWLYFCSNKGNLACNCLGCRRGRSLAWGSDEEWQSGDDGADDG